MSRVSAGDVPEITVDEAELRAVAMTLDARSGSTPDAAASALDEWRRLSSSYEAPESQAALSAMEPVTAASASVESAVGQASSALQTFAAAVESLRATRNQLLQDVAALDADVQSAAAADDDGGHWSDDPTLADADGDLRRRVSAFAEALEQAEQDCVRALDGISVSTAGLSLGADPGAGGVDWALVSSGGSFDLPLLSALAALPPAQLRRWASRNDELLLQMMNHDTDPAAVAAWWASLGDGTGAADPAAPDSLSDSQRTLLRWVPEALGDREGLPYTVRDTANRAVLASTIDDLESTIEAIESGSYVLPEGSSSAASDYAAATAALAPLLVLRKQISEATPAGSRPSLSQAQLVNLDTSVVPPLAAVAIGDVDRASHVSVMVSGMFSDVEGSTEKAMADGRVVQQSTQSRLEGDDRAATIVWLDYDSPNAATVNLPFDAQVGGERLADATRGVDAVGDARGSDAYVSVLAHSYGSTTLVEALKEFDTGVDVAATYGSPGVYANSLDDFHAPRDGVYATMSPTDLLARVGWVGAGVRYFPTGIEGVTSFSSGDETAPGGQALDASSGHSDYLRPGTTSVYNLGYIAAGRGDEVIR